MSVGEEWREDEQVQRVMRIYQKHQMMSRAGMCCSSDHPCDTVFLFDEIKRLNSQIATLSALVNAAAFIPQ